MHVLVCEDQRMMGEALAVYLRAQAGISVVALTDDPDEAIRLAHAGPDVLVLDLSLHGEPGAIDVLEALARDGIELPTLVLNSSDDLDAVVRAFTFGALGFCPKDVRPAVLYQAIVTVAAGRPAIPDALVAPLLARLRHDQRERQAATTILDGLTARELEVLRHISEGRSMAEAAELMGVSNNTVRTHADHVKDKLGVNSQLAAAAFGRWLFAATQARVVTPREGLEGD